MRRATVVVATYNRPALLAELLEDLARQAPPAEAASPTDTIFDVVVIDDGSSEPVRPIVDAFANRLQLTLIRQENSGPAAARDAGIRKAAGPIIIVVDDDMALPPSFVVSHLAGHDAHHCVVLGHIRPSPHLGDLPLFERFHARQLDHFVDAVDRGARVEGAALCTGNVSFRKEDYLRVGGFDATLGRSEDRDLGIRLEADGARFAFSKDAASVHRSDHTSVDVWRRRARLYGVFDSRISRKHPDRPTVDPWRFLFLVSPISRPVLLLATAVPSAGQALAGAAMRTSIYLDAAGFERLALKGTTLAYGLEYFVGVREERGSLRASAQALASYVARALPPFLRKEIATAFRGAIRSRRVVSAASPTERKQPR